MFPTADQIAFAIVMACRLAGTNPVLTALGQVAQRESRGRHIAFAALVDAFPDARRISIARCCGYGSGMGSAASNLPTYRKTAWWREAWIDEIVGAVVADQYGDQAQ
ncbi:hypothetical protein MesoLj131c_62510 [Mesorhizobium sp. 131-3-5]|uniref:hypothetical protein n=1 Tax=Mesorhizobium sp. 131-3-5 TaxID=2744520 RepID=UPI0019258B64|nr:hypothetical protein [Mesorhizobium sp. 131-3-5]BCH11993.1 hypothetical protein MesoLj131c_62510 [Mesorhizobium sp. 131-3-5]